MKFTDHERENILEFLNTEYAGFEWKETFFRNIPSSGGQDGLYESKSGLQVIVKCDKHEKWEVETRWKHLNAYASGDIILSCIDEFALPEKNIKKAMERSLTFFEELSERGVGIYEKFIHSWKA